jgi:hypothetical protein
MIQFVIYFNEKGVKKISSEPIRAIQQHFTFNFKSFLNINFRHFFERGKFLRKEKLQRSLAMGVRLKSARGDAFLAEKNHKKIKNPHKNI